MKQWTDQCPNRGAGLAHVHWGLCDGNHSPKHALNQCCHCGAYMAGAPAAERIEPKVTAVDPTAEYPPELAVLIEPQRRTRPTTEKPGDLTDDDKNRLRFYVHHCRPQALLEP